MQRVIRLILCLLVFSLVINTGGIALAKTYPALQLFNQPLHSPLQQPQRPQRGSIASSDPVADVVSPVVCQRLAGSRSYQHCPYRKDSVQRAVSSRPGFLQPRFLRSQLYPDALSPPPRLALSA